MIKDTVFKDSFIKTELNIGRKALVFPLSLSVHVIIALLLVIYPLLNPGDLPQI